MREAQLASIMPAGVAHPGVACSSVDGVTGEIKNRKRLPVLGQQQGSRRRPRKLEPVIRGSHGRNEMGAAGELTAAGLKERKG
jgi:hypothetical protein